MMLKRFLGFVIVLFVAILVVCYYIARQAHPVFLDEHGRPTNTQHGRY